MELKKVDILDINKLKNVIGIVFNKHDNKFILGENMVSKFSFIAGEIDYKDKTPFLAFKREWKEETGFEFPEYEIISLFVYDNINAIFYIHINESNIEIGNNHDCELIGLYSFTKLELQSLMYDNKLRKCAIDSTKKLLEFI